MVDWQPFPASKLERRRGYHQRSVKSQEASTSSGSAARERAFLAAAVHKHTRWRVAAPPRGVLQAG